MIFRRVLLALIAAAMFSAGAAVAVVALAFALYALVEPRLGRAGAAATVAAVTTGMMVIAGFGMAWAGRSRRPKPSFPLSGGLVERVFAFLREKPVVSASAAIGAGLLAIRNPKYLGAALRAFLEGARPEK